MTTMKVRASTRDVVLAAARKHGMTVDEYLVRVMQEELWRERVSDAKAAMAAPDPEYLRETADWDALEVLPGG